MPIPAARGAHNIRVQSASLVAFPVLEAAPAVHHAHIERVFRRQPFLFDIVRTAFGDVGCICIPIADRRLFDDPAATLHATLAGIACAAQHGATTVSCTGMIPAATNGLLAVQEALEASGDTHSGPRLRLTTGHETVVAAFVLNVERVCQLTGRDLSQEHVAFVGLGHIGSAALELLFRLGYRPRAVHLVDVTAKASILHTWRQRLKDEFAYHRPVTIVTIPARASLPEALYARTTFMIGATSAPNVIDIDALRPGTIIVDDSFPLGFDTHQAIKRLERRRDILITIAGALAGPQAATFVRPFDTGDAATDAIFSQIKRAANIDRFSLTGCVYSAVLVNHFALPWVLGKVNPDHALRHYQCYTQHGFHGTSIYIIHLTPAGSGVYFVGPEVVDHFCHSFATAPL